MSDCGSRLAKERDGCHEEELADSDIILDMSACAGVCVCVCLHMCAAKYMRTHARAHRHVCTHTHANE